MGHVGKNKSVISTSLDDELVAEIERRASAVGQKKGAFLRDLLVNWYERGAPPVGKLDELVQQADAREKADAKSKFDAMPKRKFDAMPKRKASPPKKNRKVG